MMENPLYDVPNSGEQAVTDNMQPKRTQFNMECLTCEERARLYEQVSKMTEEELRNDPILCCAAARMAYAQKDFARGRKWQNFLLSMREAAEGFSERKRVLESCVCCAGLAVPGLDNAHIMMSLSILCNELAGGEAPIYLSATGGRPSVLRGAKDFSEWGKSFRAVRKIVQPLLGSILHHDGKGATEAAIAELLYEKNDPDAAFEEAALAIAAQDSEIVFAGLAQLVRIGRIKQLEKKQEDYLREMESLLASEHAHWLRPALSAFQARLSVENGALEPAKKWIEDYRKRNAGASGFSYEQITAMRVYLAMEQIDDAAALMQSLLPELEKEHRPLDLIECLVAGAVIKELQGDRACALEKLHQALRIGMPYGYVRVFADYGRPIFLLTQRYVETYPPEGQSMRKYLSRIINAADEIQKQYPGMYGKRVENAGAVLPEKEKPKQEPVMEPPQAMEEQQPESQPEPNLPEAVPENESELVEKLTQTEVDVLEHLYLGMTNEEIASDMDIKLPTVKFHVAHIMDKLGAKNRTEAVVLAQKTGLLQD